MRALFGIGMGGIWGNAASMGLESMYCLLPLFSSMSTFFFFGGGGRAG